MGLKALDKRGALESRQAVWAAIRRLKSFTVHDLHRATLLKVCAVRRYIVALHAADYIAPLSKEKSQVTWQLVKDVGIEMPRVRKDGTPISLGDGRKQMWEAMRIMQTFTVRELTVAASLPDCLVQESTAATYARHLFNAGYLRKNGPVYRFLPGAYTGPLAPQVQQTQRVWDPNQRKVRWRSNEEVDNDQ